MSMLSLFVQKREGLGKGPNRRLRAQNLIPGVYYSTTGENFSLQVEKRSLEKVYNAVRRTTVFNLEFEENGKKNMHPVIVWDAQYHPIKNTITHIDFYGVDLNKEVQIKVPVEFIGVSRGAKAGGKLETYRENMVLAAKPQAIPAKITLDITTLDVNKTIRVTDIALPEGVRAIYRTNYALIACLDPKGIVEENDI